MDYLLRAADTDGLVRAFAAVTTDIAGEAARRHGTYPVGTAALGRALTAAAFLGANLKDDGAVTLRILGDGPLGGVIASANAHGEVRGYVKNPDVDLPSAAPGKLDVGRAVGHSGSLYVTTDLRLKEPYTGGAPIVSGEIAEDMANYFRVSEQTPSAVALGVLVGTDGGVLASGGLMVQVLPGADGQMTARLEDNLVHLGQVSRLINAGSTAEDLLQAGLAGVDFRVLARTELRFRCHCDRDRAAELLISLGREELADLAERTDPTEMRCHFCNEVYRFTPEEVRVLLDRALAAKHKNEAPAAGGAPPGENGPEG